MKSFKALVVLCSLIISAGFISYGQEEGKKVHLKVIKNGETMIDTTFNHEDLENENLHKKISELAGVDVQLIGSEGLHEAHSVQVSSGKSGTHGYVWISDDEEEDGKKAKKVIIKKAGEGEKGEMMFISTDEQGDIHISEDGENVFLVHADSMTYKKEGNKIILGEGDKKMEWIEVEKGEEGDETRVIIKKGDGETSYVMYDDKKIIVNKDGKSSVVKAGDKGEYKVVTIKSKDDNEKTHTIYISSDNEADVKVMTGGKMDIYMADEEDGMVFVSKEVKVKKTAEEGSDEIQIIVEIKEEKKEGVKKKKAEVKQKEKEERKKK